MYHFQFPKLPIRWLAEATCVSFLVVVCCGCISRSDNEVVVYCALDKEFSETILDKFESESNVKVLAKYDQESNKTVGLANEIIQQREKQRCDVFWNNEILHTLRLKQLGLLSKYESGHRNNYPKQFVSPDADWYGFAARARVLLVNTELLPNETLWPNSVTDLIDPKWKGNCGMAKPFFGTTATHAAVLYDTMGIDQADKLFKQIADNVNIESGNKQVAINVSRGHYAFGLTDTDDAIIELEQGNPVAIVFPDQAAEQPGTLFIPNTICLLQGSPHHAAAKRLIDFLLQQQVEEALAKGSSAQIPLHKHSKVRSRVEPENLKVMQVDFESASKNWETTKEKLQAIFPL